MLRAWLYGFIVSGAAVTFLTALGLIAAIRYGSSAGMSIGALVICVIIGLLAIAAGGYQWRQGYLQFKQRQRRIQWAQSVYATFPQAWKDALRVIWVKGSIGRGAVEQAEAFRDSCFVYLDAANGRFYLDPRMAEVFPDVIDN